MELNGNKPSPMRPALEPELEDRFYPLDIRN